MSRPGTAARALDGGRASRAGSSSACSCRSTGSCRGASARVSSIGCRAAPARRGPRVPASLSARPCSGHTRLGSHHKRKENQVPKTVQVPLPQEGETLFDTEEKIFEDIKANPGEKAFVFIHTVPYEGSVALVNLLTSTRLVRKGFDVNIILYGPGVLLASGTRGFPAVGQEAFPGHMAINNQIKTLIKEGATIYACRFAMGALYGFREDDLIPGVTAFNPLDVLDSALTAWRNGAFQINTWTV